MGLPIPTVTITVADNGANAAITVPLSNVQVKIGVCTAGTVNVPIATTSPTTLRNELGYGPLVEAGGMVCDAGGVCIAVKCPIVTLGTATAVVATTPGSGSSVVTVTLDGTVGAFDRYFVRVLVATGGTIGAAGIFIRISLDAGRTYGALIPLGTANTYAVTGTGITLNFGAGTLVAGDYYSFSTVAPAWDTAGVQAAINALAASQYGVVGWGSMHVVGIADSSAASSIQGYVNTLTNGYIFSRVLLEARDALAPTAWGGSGETESAWIASIGTAFSALDAKRDCIGAGEYNMQSSYPVIAAGAPKYRRPLTWADAVRRVLVTAQRRGGAVADGALSSITVNPATDPSDGFIYHDERINPGLNAARFMSAITWPKFPGFYICQENLFSAPGSQFTELVIGNVIDIACGIGYATGVREISDDLRLQSNGTMYTTDALAIQNKIDNALKAGMVNVALVSDAYSVVNQSANVGATGIIPIAITVVPRGYVNGITETINLAAF